MSKWSGEYLADLVERVISTAIYSVITLVTMDNVLEGPDFDTVLWPIVVLPTVLSLLKGLAANMANPESGASALPAPPGPVVVDNPPAPDRGAADVVTILLVAVLVAVLLILLGVNVR